MIFEGGRESEAKDETITDQLPTLDLVSVQKQSTCLTCTDRSVFEQDPSTEKTFF